LRHKANGTNARFVFLSLNRQYLAMNLLE